MTLLLDPMDELAAELSQIEDWLLWSDPDTDEDAELVRQAAEVAGSLSLAVRSALRDAPRFLAPDRTQLALLAWLPSEAVQAAHSALRAAVEALGPDCNRPAHTAATLDRLAACVGQDGTDDAAVLVGLLSTGGSAGRWLGLEGEDGTTRRWTTRLGPDEYATYRRYAGAVLADPLERFAASGL